MTEAGRKIDSVQREQKNPERADKHPMQDTENAILEQLKAGLGTARDPRREHARTLDKIIGSSCGRLKPPHLLCILRLRAPVLAESTPSSTMVEAMEQEHRQGLR